MRSVIKISSVGVAVLLLCGVTGCSTLTKPANAQKQAVSSENESTQLISEEKLAQEIIDLKKKAEELEQQQKALRSSQSVQNSAATITDAESGGVITLSSSTNTANSQQPIPNNPVIPGIAELPVNPQPGQCYAHVWSEPVFKTVVDTIETKAQEETIEIIPAVYQPVMENILVREASNRIERVPAKYSTVTEAVEVRPAERNWYIGDRSDSPIVRTALLEDIQTTGFDLNAHAIDGMCYHEHYYAATYENYSEQVLIKEQSERIDIVPAKYAMVPKQILVEPERQQRVTVPAVYRDITETVVDTPARNEWQQCGGSGQTQNQVMCFVSIPAKYKIITRREIQTPATSAIETIPARYETIKVREVIQEAQEVRSVEPAQYAVVTKKRKVADARYTWHQVDGGIESPDTRTGRKMCFRQLPAEYRTVAKQVEVAPETSVTVNIPAEYRSISTQKLVTPEQVYTSISPAQYETISRQEIVQPGSMVWRSILCESDFNPQTIFDIQNALSNRGYDIKSLDGIFGDETLRALNKFQRDHSLPVDQHINIQTLGALGISF